MKQLKLGIIGLSEGNGHPYSWSAIFNGYDSKHMKDCPYQVIPEYLSKQIFPKDQVKGAKVTHIWTQDPKISKHVARASKIPFIVDHYLELIDKVDAVLLARDDPENHYKMSKPFIKKGIPIYIDKPLSTNIQEAKSILALEKYPGQIFTCSGLAHAKELSLTSSAQNKIGKIFHISAVVPKDWKKYSIHIIEPTLKILLNSNKNFLDYKITNTKISQTNTHKIVTFTWNNEITTTFSTLGNLKTPIEIHLYGEKGYKKLTFKDTFSAFKNSLQTFINIVLGKNPIQSHKFILKTIETIEQGFKNV